LKDWPQNQRRRSSPDGNNDLPTLPRLASVGGPATALRSAGATLTWSWTVGGRGAGIVCLLMESTNNPHPSARVDAPMATTDHRAIRASNTQLIREWLGQVSGPAYRQAEQGLAVSGLADLGWLRFVLAGPGWRVRRHMWRRTGLGIGEAGRRWSETRVVPAPIGCELALTRD
jgi:hypothetical protein